MSDSADDMLDRVLQGGPDTIRVNAKKNLMRRILHAIRGDGVEDALVKAPPDPQPQVPSGASDPAGSPQGS